MSSPFDNLTLRDWFFEDYVWTEGFATEIITTCSGPFKGFER